VRVKDYARLFPGMSFEGIRKRFQRLKKKLGKDQGQFPTVAEIANSEGMPITEAQKTMFGS
jgi:hypothetical protein